MNLRRAAATRQPRGERLKVVSWWSTLWSPAPRRGEKVGKYLFTSRYVTNLGDGVVHVESADPRAEDDPPEDCDKAQKLAHSQQLVLQQWRATCKKHGLFDANKITARMTREGFPMWTM